MEVLRTNDDSSILSIIPILIPFELISLRHQEITRGKMLDNSRRLLILLQRVSQAIVSGLLIVLLPLLAVATYAKEPELIIEPVAVSTMPVQLTSSYEKTRIFYGKLQPWQVSDLRFPRGGRLESIAVAAGMAVEKGELLASLDVSQISAQRDELTKALEAVIRQENRLDATDAQALRQRILQLQAELRRYQTELNRPNTRPSEQLAIRIADIERQVEQLRTAINGPEAEARNNEQARIERQIASLTKLLEESQLRAPFTGEVANLRVTKGSMVAAGMLVMQVIDASRIKSSHKITTEVAKQLELDEAYPVFLNGETLDATLKSVFPDLDSKSETRTAVFALSEPDSEKRIPNTPTEFIWREIVESPGAWVPITAVTRTPENNWCVYVITMDGQGNQIVSSKIVAIEYSDKQQVRIRGDIEAGESLIRTGLHRVVPGQRVTGMAIGSVEYNR